MFSMLYPTVSTTSDSTPFPVGLFAAGMILFPLGQPIFASLGPDGISMFYVSCIVSQLVYSCGGSTFRGGIGSEMVNIAFVCCHAFS